MSKYYKFNTSRQETFLATSYTRGESFISNHLEEQENAVFVGEILANLEQLEKVENGIYKFKRRFER